MNKLMTRYNLIQLVQKEIKRARRLNQTPVSKDIQEYAISTIKECQDMLIYLNTLK